MLERTNPKEIVTKITFECIVTGNMMYVARKYFIVHPNVTFEPQDPIFMLFLLYSLRRHLNKI